MKHKKITIDDLENDIIPDWKDGHFDEAYWMEDIIGELRRLHRLETAVKEYIHEPGKLLPDLVAVRMCSDLKYEALVLAAEGDNET